MMPHAWPSCSGNDFQLSKASIQIVEYFRSLVLITLAPAREQSVNVILRFEGIYLPHVTPSDAKLGQTF